MSGPQCCSNPPTLNPSSGSGHVEKLAGLDSYLTGSPDSKLAILLIADIFGTVLSLQKSTFVSSWFGILLVLFIIWSGFFPFAILIGFSVFDSMGTDFQVVYIDGCLCICLIDLFHGISFWHFCFCLAMQDMKHPFWGMTSFATADFLVLLSVIDNFSESFFLEFEPYWLNLSTCCMLIKHVNLNSYSH